MIERPIGPKLSLKPEFSPLMIVYSNFYPRRKTGEEIALDVVTGIRRYGTARRGRDGHAGRGAGAQGTQRRVVQISNESPLWDDFTQ